MIPEITWKFMLGRLFYFLLKIYFQVISGIMLGPLFYFLLKTYFHVIAGIMLSRLFSNGLT
jgi:hypothetical protein